ncbi:hypothetical protein SDC9_125588 [bioreactor metagenome]|uniref:Uncharacterized protein n=1 Tax=bioreactor metagenome TaxID=1076179 RepID=A0A645CNT1_9ZZZZ
MKLSAIGLHVFHIRGTVSPAAEQSAGFGVDRQGLELLITALAVVSLAHVLQFAERRCALVPEGADYVVRVRVLTVT